MFGCRCKRNCLGSAAAPVFDRIQLPKSVFDGRESVIQSTEAVPPPTEKNPELPSM